MANTNNIKLLFKVVVVLLVVILAPFLFVFYFAEDVLVIIFGSEFRQAVDILRIFMVTGLLALFTMLFGYPAFAAINKIKYANLSVICGGIVQVFLLLIMLLTSNLTALNIAWSILFIEIVVLALRLFWFFRYRKLSAFY